MRTFKLPSWSWFCVGSACWLAGYLSIWWTHFREIWWEVMGQVRTHAFLMQIVPPPLINVPWAQKPWIYSKNGISCSKMVPIHSNKSCSPSTNLYARKCFSLPGWLPGFAAQYTRTLVYLLLKKTLVCCEDIILIDRFSSFRQSWKLNLHGPTIQSTMCIQLAFCAIQAFLSQFHRCLFQCRVAPEFKSLPQSSF